MPEPPRQESLLRRCAMGLWFCAIALLGLLQFSQRAFDDGRFEPGLLAWLWLAGSVACALVGAVLLARQWRR